MKQTFFLFFFISSVFFIELCAENAKEPDHWKRAYLATYPRSGNHWLRYLIEEATRIATSSVYRDQLKNIEHLKSPFPWGGYCTDHGFFGNCRYPTIDDTVVVKTHFPALKKSKFDSAPSFLTIRIVRHPVDSFYSFKVFQNRKRIDNGLLQQYIQGWKRFQNHWNRQSNVLTIRYEDMLEHPEEYLTMILAELQYEVSDEDIQRAVQKFPPNGEMLKHLDQFSNQQLRLISRELGPLMNQFGYEIP